MAVTDVNTTDKMKKKKSWKRSKRFGKKLLRGNLARFMARQSLIGDKPVFEAKDFEFLRPIEANWQTILAELQEVMKNRDAVPSFHEVSPDQKKISKGNAWKTFILYGFGYRSEKNCAQCPETARLLAQVPKLQTAWFSIMSPGYHIPPHKGVTKGIVRVHLGLIVPQDRENCYMRVDTEKCMWAPGECLVFDDTFEHEVYNNTDEDRVVLLFDFDRPMRWPGRFVNWLLLSIVKWSSYVQVPRKNMQDFEDRFQAAVRKADEAMEGR